MQAPDISAFYAGNEAREQAMAELSNSINMELRTLFERERSKGRDHLAAVLVQAVEDLATNELNAAGYGLGRLEYAGDINFENSRQTFGNGIPMGTGLILEFRGFSCKVSWSDTVE